GAAPLKHGSVAAVGCAEPAFPHHHRCGSIEASASAGGLVCITPMAMMSSVMILLLHFEHGSWSSGFVTHDGSIRSSFQWRVGAKAVRARHGVVEIEYVAV